MKEPSEDTSYFSSICIEQCRGLCCDPWWGIISYNVVKEQGLSNLSGFRGDLIKGIMAREDRIRAAYVTREVPPRPLFSRPEKYNVIIREIKVHGNSLHLNLLAMFAFRCLYLSPEKACTIHPAETGGEDIRPPHCGYMGSLKVRPDEKGYCRIIHAAEMADGETAIKTAIEIEKGASEKHYREGFPTIDMAADRLIEQLRDYCVTNMPHLLPKEKTKAPDRNAPCPCGSGIKYKKCHGR